MAMCAEACWSDSEEALATTWAGADVETASSSSSGTRLRRPSDTRCSTQIESLASEDKETLAASEDRTAIVLDWDDTLFPLTHVYRDLHLDLQKPLQEQRIPEAMKIDVAEKLRRCSEEVEGLLRLATSLGEVMIVTLSKETWVAESCRNFCPQLQECISDLGVRVLHATDGERLKGESMSSYSSRLKAQAIAEGTSRIGGSIWSSIVSIGDSDFERQGCRWAAEDLQARQAPSQVLVKTLKSMEQPTVEELTKQLQHISRWLPWMVACSKDFDLTLQDVEMESLEVLEERLRTSQTE